MISRSGILTAARYKNHPFRAKLIDYVPVDEADGLGVCAFILMFHYG